MFKHAIVKRPARALANGIASQLELGQPIYENALKQHDAYIEALKRCGVEVEVLEADERYPDSCFIEDVAVCTRVFAIVTNPGAESRNGEKEGIDAVLAPYYDHIEYVTTPGTLDGGDVMMVGDHFYIGLSERTNREGATQFIAALEKYGLSGSVVEMREMLHLKTGLAYLEDDILLVAGEFVHHPDFVDFKKIEIDPSEAYSANCIRVNDYVLVPAGYPKTRARLEAAGLSIIEVDTSEYRKVDGGLSCLSLRF